MNRRILTLLMVLLISISFYSCSKKEISYWTCPMEEHSHIKMDKPGDCPECGMELVEVKKEQKEGNILYWTCGMHPSIRADKPGKCPICKMDLVPVYEDKTEDTAEDVTTPVVKISAREKALVGLVTDKALMRTLIKEIITVGKIAYDPELTVAEEEYLTALGTYEKVLDSHLEESKTRAKKLVNQAEYRLKLLGLNTEMIEELKKSRKVHTNLILPEETAWVYAEIYESDLGAVKVGEKVEVEVPAYSGEHFRGKIRSIDPTVNPKTRSIRIRAEIDNPGLKLKPDMYANVRIENRIGKVLSIPLDAVLDTGVRKVVWVDIGNGKYTQKEVHVGSIGYSKDHTGKKISYIAVKSGLNHNDDVVTRANFLIDSQSQLTGPAESVYGGAIKGEDDAPSPAAHTGHAH